MNLPAEGPRVIGSPPLYIRAGICPSSAPPFSHQLKQTKPHTSHMNNTEHKVCFLRTHTRMSNPAIDPFEVEIACSYETPSGYWYIRITDTPKPSFNIIRMNPETDTSEGPISHYRKSHRGIWRLRHKDGDGRCPTKDMSAFEWGSCLEGVYRALQEIREVKDTLEQDKRTRHNNFSRN